MSVLDVFCDQQVAHDVFKQTGMVRVQFSELNNSPCDMLNVYARRYLEFAETQSLLDAVCKADIDYLKPNAKALYLFSDRTYKTFLQMSIRECSTSDKENVATALWEELYTSVEEVADANRLPVLSTSDISLFNSIDTSVYARELPRDRIHMLHIDTRIKRNGCVPVVIAEILLYLPSNFN